MLTQLIINRFYKKMILIGGWTDAGGGRKRKHFKDVLESEGVRSKNPV
jgi:hypothetical protein